MGSKGRMPPPQQFRRPLPQGLHPEAMMGGPAGGLHGGPFDMLPPPQVLEQKLASQHVEMQRLATENQRLAATHGVLRQELAAAQHELQMLQVHTEGMKAEREQQMRVLQDRIVKMEAELRAAEPLKMELQQAHGEAQSLLVSRDELIAKAQHLGQEIQRVHGDVQQIPALISELEGLRQEYQHCRATFEYEKKLYSDHLESLQGMEKNYVSMSREVEKLRAELTNTANVDRRSSGPYGSTSGTNENEASGLPVGQNAYEDGYAVAQGRGPVPPASGGGNANLATTAGHQPGQASAGAGYDAPKGPGYIAPAGPGYDAPKGPGYIAPAGPTYDAQRSGAYDPQRLTGYDAYRGSAYDSKRGPIYDAQRTGYDPQRGQGYDVQRGPAYDASRSAGYDTQPRGVAGPPGHAPPVNNMPYGSSTPPSRGGGGFDAARGGNPARR